MERTRQPIQTTPGEARALPAFDFFLVTSPGGIDE